jgi:hypothetical protein
MSICGGFKELSIIPQEKMKETCTRQLLKELRNTYSCGCCCCWNDFDWEQLRRYRQELKRELATREHIPNKIESKRLRKAKIKKGK